MGYEISEALYAGLSSVPDATLNAAKTDGEAFETLYETAKEGFEGAIDGAGDATKKGMAAKIQQFEREGKTQQLRNDLAASISAVLGTRSTTGKGIPSAVYLTGNKWAQNIQQFNIPAFGMKDYNSSDIILQYGDEYIGVSLKKKATAAAASPPLINNSFATFIAQKDLKSLQDEINVVRKSFFAQVLKDACSDPDIFVDGNKDKLMECDEILQLDPDNEKHAQRIWDMRVSIVDTKTKKPKKAKIPLINMKDISYLSRALNKQFPIAAQTKFRTYVNSRLNSSGNEINELYQKFYNVMNNPTVLETLADSLLNRTLKTQLESKLQAIKAATFSFYLVEGAGRVTKSRGTGAAEFIPHVQSAHVVSLKSIVAAMSTLSKGPASIRLDKSKTIASGAMVHFYLQKSGTDILHITLRYGGNFQAMPRFHATMTQDFKKLLH